MTDGEEVGTALKCDFITEEPNELNGEDFRILEDFKLAIRQLSSKIKTIDKLGLQNKLGGLLPEILAVLTLKEVYPEYNIIWKGANTKDYDMILSNKDKKSETKIQIKKMTAKDKHFYYWQTREIKEITCPWIFVYLDEKLNPLFFVASEDEMIEFKRRLEKEIEILKEWRAKNHDKWRSSKATEGGNPMAQLRFYFSKEDYNKDVKEWKRKGENKEHTAKYWPEFYENKTGIKELNLFEEDYISKFKKIFEKRDE